MANPREKDLEQESEPRKSLLDIAKRMAVSSWENLSEAVKKIQPEFAAVTLLSGLITFCFLGLLNLHFQDLGSITEGGNNLAKGVEIYGKYLANFAENFPANPQLYAEELTPLMGIVISGLFTVAWGSGIIATPANTISHETSEVATQ